MRAFTLFISLFFYLSLSLALPWPVNLLVRDATGQLRPRDDPPPQTTSAAPAQSASQNTATNTEPPKTVSIAPTGTNTSPPSKTTDDGDKKGDDKTTDDKPKETSSISIDPRLPAGGLSMVKPAPTTTTYYKYGDNITWIWNYTSLVVTPSVVNVLVSCQDTFSTFTVAQNVSVNATQSITWDTSKETGADITDKYTLVVYDAGNPAGVSASAEPGKLGVFDAFTFAIYTPQPYQAIKDGYKCVTCNGAVSSAERQALGVMATLAIITFLSFGYFANGFLTL